MSLINDTKNVLDYQNEVIGKKESFNDSIKEGFSYYNYDIFLKVLLYTLLYYITVNDLIEHLMKSLSSNNYKILQTLLFGILAYLISIFL